MTENKSPWFKPNQHIFFMKVNRAGNHKTVFRSNRVGEGCPIKFMLLYNQTHTNMVKNLLGKYTNSITYRLHKVNKYRNPKYRRNTFRRN